MELLGTINGAFVPHNPIDVVWAMPTGKTTNHPRGFNFNASRSSGIYKTGFHSVQPESLRIYFIVKYADL